MSAFLPIAIGAVIKATILVALIAGVTHLLRRRSAALRHLLWTFAVAGMAAIPLLAAMLPISLPVLPGLPEASAERLVQSPSARVEAAEAASGRTIADDATERESIAAPEPAIASRLSLARLDGVTLAVGIWIAGMLLMLGRFGIGVAIVRAVARRARPITDETWHVAADSAARAHGLTAPVDLRVSDDVAMPFACGLARPVVVLPTAALAWTAERRDAVLLHEFAHISRGDLAMNTLSHVVRALYWFHPLAWLAAHRVRVEGERACDDAVLRAGARPSDYAEHLLSIVRTVGNTVPSAALAMARRSDFEGRLLAILEPGIPRGRLTRWRAATMAAAFLGVVTPLAAMTPARAAVRVLQEPVVEARSERLAPNAVLTALIETLGDGSAAVRTAAARSLGALEDPRAIAALSKALREDSDARVREAAAHALGEIDDARAVPALLEALKAERVASVREEIVRALGEIDDPSAVGGIAAVLKDASVEVRRAAVWALGELEDRSAVTALLPMIRDDDVEVRKNTAEALGHLEDASAIDALTQLTRDANRDVRVHAVEALGHFEDRRILSTLLVVLKDSDADVRQHAAEAIGNLDDLGSAPRALIEALSDTDADVRRNVAHALGHIGDAAAVPALKRAITDSDADVRRTSAEALAEIGGAEAMQALVALLKDPDPEIRRIAAEALGNKRE